MSTVPAAGRPLVPVMLPLTVTGAVPATGLGVTVVNTVPVAGPTVRGNVYGGVGPTKAGEAGA